MVEDDARRRIAEEKGPDHVADVAIRPSIDKLAFTAARRSDLEEMRRQIFPLARRLATRLTKEHHAHRRGALDFRRTVRASIATGGVPLTTHHRPKRPHRTDLVVLCDVSGSVANFAQFTLLFVFALREVFQSMRAFTFIDHVHEVTEHLRPGSDPVEVLERLAAASSYAALWGRTNYGRAFAKFEEEHFDALGPKTTLADPRRRAQQLQRPRGRHAPPARGLGTALVLAQSRTGEQLGRRRLRREDLPGDRLDGRVPQPHPAPGVRARPPVTADTAKELSRFGIADPSADLA